MSAVCSPERGSSGNLKKKRSWQSGLPLKRKSTLFQRLDGEVDGWPFKVYDDGKVQLGTAAKGQPYARWSFKLSSYEEDAAVEYSEHVADCIKQEIVRLKKGSGPRHSSHVEAAGDANGSAQSDREAGALFGSTEVILDDVAAFVRDSRKRTAAQHFQPDGAVRDKRSADGKRRKLAACAEDDEPCKKAACVAARAARDTAQAERDDKVAELRALRGHLLELATQTTGGVSSAGVAARAIQAALLEILDGVEEDGMEGGDDEVAGMEARDEVTCDEPVGDHRAEGSAGGVYAQPPLPRLSLPTRPVAGSAGELSMVGGALVHVVDGARLAQHALGLISSAACQVEQPNPFTRLARVRVSLRSSVELSYESTDVAAAFEFCCCNLLMGLALFSPLLLKCIGNSLDCNSSCLHLSYKQVSFQICDL